MMDLLSEGQRARVEHIACDFLTTSEEIAKEFQEKGVTADAVFFYSYAHPRPVTGERAWTNAQELSDVNCRFCASQ
jgi:hypothetical protein